MESISAALGTEFNHVPYKGTPLSVTGFLSGDVTFVLGTFAPTSAQVKAGKGKYLGVTSLKRTPLAPDVPAVSETIAGFDYSSEVGLLAPAGTPAPIIQKLWAAAVASLKDPDNVPKLRTMGADPVGSTPQAYAENLRLNREKFAAAVERSGAKAE
jgi:tripartite-type tricarboxylate transporter receptor subunit TctC